MKVEQKVLSIFRDWFSQEDINANTNLEEIGMDNLDYVEIIEEFEEQFDVVFDDSELWEDGNIEAGDLTMETPAEFIKLIKQKLNDSNS
jgi:acyl carrier protein